MAVTQNLVPAVVSGVGGLATALAGAPWWTTVLCLGLTLIVTSLQLVFPQESRDRLAWWKDRREYLQGRRAARRRRDP
ncbi:hypothetical protein ACWCY6_42635 [Streptomyces sp. 900105755]|uniref:hypothetical protein n=1 Tax=Streptomyces sp. NPDC001507 TaxID=3364579 RepID=UPI0036A4F684